jgi:L-fuculose-phosphate aldolase
MANHGALTVGPDIYTAYYKMETMEHFAYIDWIARTLGRVNQLREEELRKLLELRKRFGTDKPIYSMCPVLSALQTDEKPPVRTVSMDEQELTEIIVRVTASILKEL